MDVGNNQGTQPGTVVFTGNTICGPGAAAVEFYAFQVIPTVAYRQQNFVFKNNIIANVGSSEVNMRLTYAPSNWIANGNIYDPQGRYYWNNASLGTSFASWRSASGQDAGSKTGTPTFVDIPSGDLHLDPNDTVARGFGVDITDITGWDIDGDPRDPFSPTAGADVGSGTADTDPPTIVAWASAGEHGRGVGEALLDIPDDGSFSEPRSGGIAKLIVDFSERMDPLSFTPGAVQIAGLDAGGQPVDLGGIVIGTELRDSDTAGVITFTPPLPDYARYAVGITGATDRAGNELVGDVDRIVAALCGDVSGDLRVNATDFSRVRAARTRLIDPGVADQVRADVSMDGRINASDLSRIRARRSNDARGITDPGL